MKWILRVTANVHRPSATSTEHWSRHLQRRAGEEERKAAVATGTPSGDTVPEKKYEDISDDADLDAIHGKGNADKARDADANKDAGSHDGADATKDANDDCEEDDAEEGDEADTSSSDEGDEDNGEGDEDEGDEADTSDDTKGDADEDATASVDAVTDNEGDADCEDEDWE